MMGEELVMLAIPWPLLVGLGVLVVGGVAVAAFGGDEERERTYQPTGQGGADRGRGDLADATQTRGGGGLPSELEGKRPQLRNVGSALNKAIQAKRAETRTDLADLIALWPGVAELQAELAQRGVEMLIDPGRAGMRETLQTPGSRWWETETDRENLRKGWALRFHPLMFSVLPSLPAGGRGAQYTEPGQPEPAAHNKNRVFLDNAGSWYTWSQIRRAYDRLPIAHGQELKVRLPDSMWATAEGAIGRERAKAAAAFPMGLSYGDSDRILSMMIIEVNFEGIIGRDTERKRHPASPADTASPTVALMFPPMRPTA